MDLATLTSRETKQPKFNVRYAAPRHSTIASIRRRCDLIKSRLSFTRLPHNSLLPIQLDQFGAHLWLHPKCEVNQRHLSRRRPVFASVSMVQAPTQLPKRALGKTGVHVSCVGMGCSPFGHAYGVCLQGSAELESLPVFVASHAMMLYVNCSLQTRQQP